VAGIVGDLTVYPLAFTYDKLHGVFAGLGLGGTIHRPFWPDSTSKADPTQKYPTSELKVEGGLRWPIVLYKKVPRPTLLFNLGGGLHSFSLGKDASGADVGPADVAYKYLTIGAGLRVYFAEFVYLWALFNYHVVFNSGTIQDPATEYGAANTFGLRIGGGLTFFVYKGLNIGGSAYYERFKLTFTGAGMPAKQANSGTDQYFGGILSIGYML
jgi:hypothetical protein